MRTGIIQLTVARVDLDTRQVTRDDGTEARLTTREAELLAWLAQRPGQDISRDELQREVWGYAEGARTRTVDSTMARLRRKVEADGRRPEHLIAVTGLGYRFVPLVTADAGVPSVLEAEPPAQEALLGRTAVLAELQRALESSRLVTLHGVGGQGKTTVARHLKPDLFVDLSDAQTAEEVGGAVLRELGVPAAGSAAAAAGRVLARRGKMRVVLDNGEGVIGPLTEVLPGWIGEGECVFLVTSRVPLGLESEHRYALPPLDTRASEGLFARLTGQAPAEAGRRLVARLGGHPLAIELAASRARRLSVDALEARAARWLDLLKDEKKSPGHTDVRTILDGSWELFEPAAREAWVRLAVVGGGDLELADAVLGDSIETLDLLREHALVHQDGGHWSFPDLVMAYARERAQPEVEAEVLRAVVVHGERLLKRCEGPECIEAMGALVSLQPALERAQRLEGEWASRAFLAMGPALVARLVQGEGLTSRALENPPAAFRASCLVLAARAEMGRSAEARAGEVVQGWLNEAIECAVTPVQRAEAELFLGVVESLRRSGPGRERVEAAVEVIRSEGEPHQYAAALNTLAPLLENAGVDPWSTLRKALRTAERADCRWQEAIAQVALASLHDDRGRLEESETAFREASAILLHLSDQRRFAMAILRYAARLLFMGQRDKAQKSLEQLLETAVADPRSAGHGWTLIQLGYIALDNQDSANAMSFARRVESLGRRHGRVHLEVHGLILEVRLYICAGDVEDAQLVFEELLALDDLRNNAEVEVEMLRLLLEALQGRPVVLPPVIATSTYNRRLWLRTHAFVAAVAGLQEQAHALLDELEACTVEGHRELRADMAVFRGYLASQRIESEAMTWRSRVLLSRL